MKTRHNNYLVENANRFMNESPEQEVARRMQSVRDKYVGDGEDVIETIMKVIDDAVKSGIKREVILKQLNDMTDKEIKSNMQADKITRDYDKQSELEADAEDRLEKLGLTDSDGE